MLNKFSYKFRLTKYILMKKLVMNILNFLNLLNFNPKMTKKWKMYLNLCKTIKI